MRVLRNIAAAVVSLVVDDGLLAVAALGAIGIVWVLGSVGIIDTTDLTGWLLFSLLALTVVVSCRRAVNRYLAAEETPTP